MAPIEIRWRRWRRFMNKLLAAASWRRLDRSRFRHTVFWWLEIGFIKPIVAMILLDVGDDQRHRAGRRLQQLGLTSADVHLRFQQMDA